MQQVSRSAELVDGFMEISESILKNEYMYVIMFAFVLCIIAVSLISHSSMKVTTLLAVETSKALVQLSRNIISSPKTQPAAVIHVPTRMAL